MALDDQEHDTAVTTENSQLKELKGQVMELTEQVAALTKHFQRNYPNRQRVRDDRHCFMCGLPGHLAKDCHQGNGNGASALGNRHPCHQ